MASAGINMSGLVVRLESIVKDLGSTLEIAKLIEDDLTSEVREILNDVYGSLWAEAYYDSFNESTQRFARPLADKMARLNKIVKFKE